MLLTRKDYERIVGDDLTSYKPNFLIPSGIGFSKNEGYYSDTELFFSVGKNNMIDHNGYGYYVPGENMIYQQTKISYMNGKSLQIDLIAPNTYMVKTVD